MRHQVRGRKLNRTKSHRDAMLANMAASLFEHKQIHTTEAKAKELRPYAEALITKARHALSNEKQNRLPDGQTIDIHNRRQVYRYIRSKAIVQELFDNIAPTLEGRNGGYTRITKTGPRRGDAAQTAIIGLVDWAAPIDGAISLKRKKKATQKQQQKSTKNEKLDATPVTDSVPPTPTDVVAVETAPIEEMLDSTPTTEATTDEVVANEETTPTEETEQKPDNSEPNQA